MTDPMPESKGPLDGRHIRKYCPGGEKADLDEVRKVVSRFAEDFEGDGWMLNDVEADERIWNIRRLAAACQSMADELERLRAV